MAKKKKKTVKQTKEDDAKRWDKECSKGNDAAISYAISQVFEADQVINHDSFGFGIVLMVIDKKIEVLFDGERKLLVHNIS
jgi:hypothetical protein